MFSHEGSTSGTYVLVAVIQGDSRYPVITDGSLKVGIECECWPLSCIINVPDCYFVKVSRHSVGGTLC